MNEARRQFYKNFIEANKLFAAAKKLLNHGDKRVAFPPSVDKLEFSNQMGTYFVEKIHNIHTNLENMGHDLPEFEVYNTSETTAHLSNFNTLTEEDVRTLIKECGKKNSAVDPQEVTLLVTQSRIIASPSPK
jgi:antirestriction protein ArdC